MPNLTTVDVTNGIPTSGTGTVSTIDALIAAIAGVAHDAAAASQAPILIGGYGSAAAPSDVSATNDAVRAWFLLNGSQVVAPINNGHTASATFTPAAASHVANDVNGGAQQFSSVSKLAVGNIMITGASLEIDGGTAEATAWRLYLYNVTPPSATADDGAWDLPSGDRTAFLGYVDLGTAVDLGSTQWVEVNGINKHILTASANIFGYLVNLTTLTPAAVAHIVTLHTVDL